MATIENDDDGGLLYANRRRQAKKNRAMRRHHAERIKAARRGYFTQPHKRLKADMEKQQWL